MAVLTTAQRKKMPKSQFAVPSKATDSGSYPIGDRKHVINALARVSQFGSAEEKAKVRAAVYAKYPDLRPQGKKKPAAKKKASADGGYVKPWMRQVGGK